MIWRIRDRVVFDRFRRDGRRARVGSLWMTVITDPQAVPPRVAYAVGRSVGSAPMRNRVRRRLRSLVRARAHELAPGWYLIGADAPMLRLTFSQLEEDFLAAALESGGLTGPGVGPSNRQDGSA